LIAGLSLFAANTERVPYEFINYLISPKSDYDNHLILVEKQAQKAYLYEINKEKLSLKLLNEYNVTTGKQDGDKQKKGDLRTPQGFYLIDGEIPKSRLTPKFGYGAFPLNYPNSIDQYLKKTGFAIWLHGTDKPITPKDTEGCVRFTNKDLEILSKKFQFGKTVTIINDQINWVTVDQLGKDADYFKNAINQWKESWESQDLTSYLQFYHTDFYTENLKMNFERWAKYKERINKKRADIHVKLSDIKYFYSNDYMLVEFKQEYRSATYSDVGKKSMLWKREETDWMILREEWDGYAIPVKSMIKADFDKQLPESADSLKK
jgi:murein L,D-transpeptidase YafK